jgi:type IV secretory pathway VirB9-like protein
MAVLKRTLFIITRDLMLKKQEKWYTNIIITTETTYNISKRNHETKNKYNYSKCSKWPPFICKHNRAHRKRLRLEFVTISGVIVAKAS